MAEVDKERVVEAEKLVALVTETSRGPSGPRLTSYPGDTPGPEESSGGPKGGARCLGAPVRGACLWCWSLELNVNCPPQPWPNHFFRNSGVPNIFVFLRPQPQSLEAQRFGSGADPIFLDVHPSGSLTVASWDPRT
jgi:hypothetical protein